MRELELLPPSEEEVQMSLLRERAIEASPLEREGGRGGWGGERGRKREREAQGRDEKQQEGSGTC